MATEPVDYCRQVEAYLCQKNDGHLIRVVGPSFEVVSRWAAEGIPLTIAFRGVDRYFERYYRKGQRRRPVRIEFCDDDVRDLFDEWRRAVGLPAGDGEQAGGQSADEAGAAPERRGRSLPAHLARIVLRLTSARASGKLGDDADRLIDRIAQDLDAAKEAAGGLRGEKRQQLIARLATFDRELLDAAFGALGPDEKRAVHADAERELATFRHAMSEEAYARAQRAAMDRLVRERAGLPAMIFD